MLKDDLSFPGTERKSAIKDNSIINSHFAWRRKVDQLPSILESRGLLARSIVFKSRMYLPLQAITSQRESERDHAQNMSDTCSLVLIHTDNEFLPVSTWQASASLLTALQLVFNITQHVFQTNCLSPALHTPPSDIILADTICHAWRIQQTSLSHAPVYFSTLFVVLSRKQGFQSVKRMIYAASCFLKL